MEAGIYPGDLLITASVVNGNAGSTFDENQKVAAVARAGYRFNLSGASFLLLLIGSAAVTTGLYLRAKEQRELAQTAANREAEQHRIADEQRLAADTARQEAEENLALAEQARKTARQLTIEMLTTPFGRSFLALFLTVKYANSRRSSTIVAADFRAVME